MSNSNVQNVKRQFVDPHVHFWNVENGWYFFPTVENNFGLGDVSSWPNVYSLDDYRHDSSSVQTKKIVHVSATATAEGALKETFWLDDIAKQVGFPHAIIGTIDISKASVEIERDFDDQMKSPLFRGIRMLHGLDYRSQAGDALLKILDERKLIYDVVAHPGGGIADAAYAAARHPGLVFALEHTGWPLQAAGDLSYWEAWKAEMAEFAALPNTNCKLSGLGMTYHHTNAAEYSRYWKYCLEIFGPSRCMFASNFPVEKLYGSFNNLFEAFELAAADLSEVEQKAVFEGTAERVYRI